MIEILEYLNDDGVSPFSKWFNALSAQPAAKLTTALARMETGNLSHCKSLGNGLWENKLDFGPGYRIYFGKAGTQIIILVAGGTKSTQAEDIKKAKKYWEQFQKSKRGQLWH